MTPQEIIATLGMERHPEGGWYVQTFRDPEGGARGHSTCIYYLLERGERSHWHRVRDATEIWHHYAGEPIALSLSNDGVANQIHVLGPNLAKGERPQVLVPANWWQSAEPLGEWTLVGCTVAPGFSFDAFELAPPGWRPGG
ncbi:putative cupin superfamily sugar epimerase [Mycoplana sp. BE70]|uniref:cupin domain-containing protein n=1 Tax=Mycoplana sp. BE70 TaxID=2817775 RepID=UPI0028633A3B|nr:cupin domain-containing protein [Mycoplana sp. BE70]MDR6755454.1 putative cupin superfamily sugar epimerase [Mycoplana sp. BE70]